VRGVADPQFCGRVGHQLHRLLGFEPGQEIGRLDGLNGHRGSVWPTLGHQNAAQDTAHILHRADEIVAVHVLVVE
jgi:hypothetical protein